MYLQRLDDIVNSCAVELRQLHKKISVKSNLLQSQIEEINSNRTLLIDLKEEQKSVSELLRTLKAETEEIKKAKQKVASFSSIVKLNVGRSKFETTLYVYRYMSLYNFCIPVTQFCITFSFWG